jgi:hypothetical protein
LLDLGLLLSKLSSEIAGLTKLSGEAARSHKLLHLVRVKTPCTGL